MSKTLLLADDSVTIQKVVGISFANEDVKLVTVDNGDDAIARARELRPDAVLADVVMPGKSGYEVCEAIKAEPSLRHVPVLLLTGTFEAFDEERAREVGAAGHVSKPFEAQALVERVRELFASAPAPAAPAAEPAAAAAATATGPAGEATDAGGDRVSEDAFDFFDDEADDLSQSDPLVAEPVADAGDPLEFEEPEGAFDFGDAGGADDEPLAFESPEEDPRGRGAEPTMAILSEEDDAAWPPRASAEARPEPTVGEHDLADLDAEPPALWTPPEQRADRSEGEHSEDTAPEPLAPIDAPAAEEAFDFDLDEAPAGDADDSLLRVDSDDLAQATVIDPLGASGYDVSSSDLGDPLAPPETSGSGREIADAPGATGPALGAEPAAQEAPDAGGEPEPFVEATPVPELETTAPPHPATASAAEAAPGPPRLDEIAPHLRERLHDTLEKIAWESFSDVTEKIVRQAVERVEAIAWEVIPQLADALIREEIARIKGGEDDS